MDIKDVLIALLQKLSPCWDLADGYIAMVETSANETQLINKLCHIFAQVVRTTKSQLIKEQFEESLHALEMIQQKEKTQQVEDKEAAEDILADWDNK